jgi:hypothetical protein
MPSPTLDRIDQLKQAVIVAEEIQKLEAQLTAVLNGSSAPAPAKSPAEKGRKGKRKMSPATIAKMKAAQQARWAKKKGSTLTPAPATEASKPAKKERKMSAKAQKKRRAAKK